MTRNPMPQEIPCDVKCYDGNEDYDRPVGAVCFHKSGAGESYCHYRIYKLMRNAA